MSVVGISAVEREFPLCQNFVFRVWKSKWFTCGQKSWRGASKLWQRSEILTARLKTPDRCVKVTPSRGSSSCSITGPVFRSGCSIFFSSSSSSYRISVQRLLQELQCFPVTSQWVVKKWFPNDTAGQENHFRRSLFFFLNVQTRNKWNYFPPARLQRKKKNLSSGETRASS